MKTKLTDVKHINKISKKMDDLIMYAVKYIHRESMRRIKHNNTKKLYFYKNHKDPSIIMAQYGCNTLFSFSYLKVYTPAYSTKTITIGDHCMDLKEYDKSDIFSLSTLYDIELLKWLQVGCKMKESHLRNISILNSISEQLVNEAHSAYQTQYHEIDKEKFHIYQG